MVSPAVALGAGVGFLLGSLYGHLFYIRSRRREELPAKAEVIKMLRDELERTAARNG